MSLLSDRIKSTLAIWVGGLLLGLPNLSFGQTVLPPKWGFNPTIEPATVACSPDGSLVGVGSGSGVCIYSVATQLPYSGINVTSGTVFSMQFSPDGQTVAIVNGYNRVELWNYQLGKFLGSLAPNSSMINAMAFSPNGQDLAVGGVKSGGVGGMLEEWNVSRRTRNGNLKTRATAVYSVAYSPDGTLLAEGGVKGSEGSVELWASHLGALVRDLAVGDLTCAYSVVFPQKGTAVACAGTTASQGAVIRWDVATGAVGSEQKGNLQFGVGTALSPDATQVLLYGASQTTELGQAYSSGWVDLWDVSDMQFPVSGWNLGWEVAGAAFSADGATLCAIWTSDSWFGTGVSGAFEPTGGYFSILTAPGNTAAFSLPIAQQGVWPGPTVPYVQPAFSPDGKLVVGGGADYGARNFSPGSGLVNIWESGTGRLHTALPTGAGLSLLTSAFSYDDDYLAIAGFGAAFTGVQIWSIKSSTLLNSLALNITPLQIAFSPRGDLLAIAGSSGSGNDVIQLWDYSTGKLVRTLVSDANNGIYGLAFSKSSSNLAVAGSYTSGVQDAVSQGILEIWNVGLGIRAELLPTKMSVVNGVTFSPNGNTLAAAGQYQAAYGATTDGKIETWNIANRKLMNSLPLFTGTTSVTSVSFSESGTALYAVTSGGPGAVQVIDLVNDKLLGYLNSPGYGYLALSTDCKLAASSFDSIGLTVSAVPALVSAPLKSISFSPASISEDSVSVATVTLVSPAPAGGLTVGIEAAVPAGEWIDVPSTLTIPAGATSASFAVQSFYIDSSSPVTITVLSGTYSISGSLSAVPPNRVRS